MFHRSLVREIRKRYGLNQKEFAEKLGVSQSAVSGWEKMGMNTPKNADMAICNAMHLQLWELYISEEERISLGAPFTREEDLILFNKITKLDNTQKKLLGDFLDSMAPKNGYVVDNIENNHNG